MSGFDRYAQTEKLAAVPPRTRRASPRAHVSWTAWVRVGQERKRFHTVDVSPRGAKDIPGSGRAFLAKPFSIDGLARRVRETLDRPSSFARPSIGGGRQ
jgi:hypothetical protein